MARPIAMAWPLCYHAGLSKKRCEDILARNGKDGAFLVRDSETVPGMLCLCVYKQAVVYTYRVVTSDGYLSLEAGEGVKKVFFRTLKDMISHYRERGQGLAIHLRFRVNRVTPPLVNRATPPLVQRQLPRQQVTAVETVYDNDIATYVTVLPS